MEMRTLTHSLRLRPTSLLTPTPQTTLLQRPLAFTLRHASSSNKPPRTPTATPSDPTPKSVGTSDFDQILSKLNINNTSTSTSAESTTNTSTTPSTEASNPSGAAGNAPRQSVFGDALSLGRAVGLSAGTDNYRPAVRKVELKLGPTLGRQVHVEPERGTDLAGALRMLQMTCNANRLRNTVHAQRYHVRRGQLRKNLRMQRWRRLFKFSFDKTVSKIQRMRAQGW